MEYAVEVENYTLTKANNLVLNVDGAIGSLFLDLLAGSGMFTKQEVDEIVEIGYLNGLFVLARSIGLIGWVSFWFYKFVSKSISFSFLVNYGYHFWVYINTNYNHSVSKLVTSLDFDISKVIRCVGRINWTHDLHLHKHKGKNTYTIFGTCTNSPFFN